jgi:HPt (histidine-containing phosphotransfer) domain-containing protein
LLWDSSTGYAKTIREAVIHRDAEALLQAAHALKWSSAMIGALALLDFARDLEQIGLQARYQKN